MILSRYGTISSGAFGRGCIGVCISSTSALSTASGALDKVLRTSDSRSLRAKQLAVYLSCSIFISVVQALSARACLRQALSSSGSVRTAPTTRPPADTWAISSSGTCATSKLSAPCKATTSSWSHAWAPCCTSYAFYTPSPIHPIPKPRKVGNGVQQRVVHKENAKLFKVTLKAHQVR